MKALKIAVIIFISIVAISLIVMGGYFFVVYSKAQDIDVRLEDNLDKFVFLQFYDAGNNKAPLAGMDFCESGKILDYTKNAFVAKEDRRFYAHNGIDFRGILRAGVANLKSGKATQGGSTITQQLAKNLVLSSEKKLSRKITEVALARKIEKNYSKDEILTTYLNVIYFGENTFGITDASMLYFGKKPCELTLSESAMLAGIIPSPENYSPVKSVEIATEKRNLVLKIMLSEGYISESEYAEAVAEKLVLNITKNSNLYYDYFNHTLKESADILGVSEGELCRKNYRIFTYINPEKQQLLNELGSGHTDSDAVIIAIDNSTCGVSGVYESGHDLILKKRAPASLIKPLFVYAPSLEENVIFENSIISDVKTDFGDYHPRNFMDIYYGDVTAKTALAKSLNVPSVKILESLTLKKAAAYGNKMGLELSSGDVGLSVALGGLYDGFSPFDLVSGYACLANGGAFQKGRFVREIQDVNGEIIYSADTEKTRVFGDDTAFIVTDMLKECTHSGTAKGLGEISPYIASKTGTNGDKKGNIDAYSCSYTSCETLICWLGNRDYSYMESSIKGSSVPVEIAKKFYEKSGEICDFERPDSVCELKYDRDEYLKNGKLLQATSDTPPKFIGKTWIAKRFYPLSKSLKYSYPRVLSPTVSQSGDYLEIAIGTQEFARYEIIDFETRELVAEVIGNGDVSSVVLPAEGEFAQFEIVAYNTVSGKKGEGIVTDKLYIKKDFMPKSSVEVPTGDDEILEFFEE